MARDNMVLGEEVGGYVLPHVLAMSVQRTVQSFNGTLDEDRFGGFFVARRPGPTTITLSMIVTVDDCENDALDIAYSQALANIYNLCNTNGTTKLWIDSDWFWEVGLENITEDEITDYRAKFAATFFAKRGKRQHRTLHELPVFNGDAISFTSSPIEPDPIALVYATAGVPITISSSAYPGLIRIDPVSTGVITLDLHQNTATRDGVDATDEVSFGWPRWYGLTTVTLTGAPSLMFKWRNCTP
jgi:hypothetical protein